MNVFNAADGIGGIGWVCGYMLFFALKRYLPPISANERSPREIALLITTIVGGSFLGTRFISMDGNNYIGPYGVGLFLGVVVNLILTLTTEFLFHWLPQVFGVSTTNRDTPSNERNEEEDGNSSSKQNVTSTAESTNNLQGQQSK